MKVELETEIRKSVKCPQCNTGVFHVGHMLTEGNTWKWGCSKCEHSWKFTYLNGELDLEPAPTTDVRGLALVAFAGNTLQEKLYFIVEVYFHYDKDGNLNPDWEDQKRYYIEEHTCPINLISCSAIIYNGDTDPHGVVEYVRAAPYSVICQQYNITIEELLDSNNQYMFHYFHECGAVVDDEEVALDKGYTIEHEDQTKQLNAPDNPV